MGSVPPNGKDAEAALNNYLRTLPPELAERIRKTNGSLVASYLTKNKGNGTEALAGLVPSLHTTKAIEILTKTFPPLPWLITDTLAPGLAFVSGKPKVGKSWLVLQMAVSVATGGIAFGKTVKKGKVLYLALEDSQRRLNDRMSKQGWTKDAAENVDFYLSEDFQQEIGFLNAGGSKRLLAHIEKEKYILVIVDTFSRAFRGDQNKLDEMGPAISPIQSHAVNSNYTFLIVDHMPKNTGFGTDPISHIYGSIGKAGMVDTAWGLYKEQGKYGAKLHIVGRELEEKILQLSFTTPGFYWHCEGDAYEFLMTENKKLVLEALTDLGRARAKEIAETIDRDLSNVLKILNDLCNAGLARRDGKDFLSLVVTGSTGDTSEPLRSTTSDTSNHQQELI
jgi:RecA-family ATPase